MSIVNLIRRLQLAALACVLGLAAHPALAAWWEFGRNPGEPVVTELKFNKVDALRIEQKMQLGADELERGGVLIVRGRAEIGKGTIGAVELTLDGGKTWFKAALDERGFFTHEFKPEPQRDYGFAVRALTVTGASSDAEAHAFVLSVSSETAVDQVRRAFLALLDAYSRENRSAFMRGISPDFDGIVSALEDAVSDDFRHLDNIRIEPNIARIVPFAGGYEVYFTFNRSVTSSRTGQQLRDSAATTITFQRTGEGFKVSRMAAPLIFGVSNPEDIATQVTGESVGKPVLVLDPRSGAAGTATQGQTVAGAASAAQTKRLTYNNTGPGVLWFSQGFEFDTESVVSEAAQASPPQNSDFALFGDNFHITTSASVQMAVLGNVPIDSLTEAPATGYTSYSTWPGYRITSGSARTFAFRLPGNKYAVVEFISLDKNTRTALFRYRIARNGRVL